MLKKINRDNLKFKILNLKFPIFTLLALLLVYTRFVNIGWGLSYPMHPDERNMAVAIQNLSSVDWFDPHFFAYGQFPLYLGYFLVWLMKVFDGDLSTPIGLQEAILSLRIISTVASVVNVFILYKIIFFILNIKNQISKIHIKYQKLLILLILILSPYAIQFSHFGTTESLLMLFYSLITYYSLKMLEEKIVNSKYLILTSLFSGIAIATKVSSIIFVTVPIITLISNIKDQKSNPSSKLKILIFTLGFALYTLIFALFFSPHNLFNWKEFISSMRYESDVAIGRILVFYTRQFVDSTPVWFQLTKVFPYAMGMGMGLMGLIGFIGLSWKDKRINLLRLAFFVYFFPNAFLFAKWTRFMAPVFPILSIFAILFISNIKNQISKIHIKNQKFLHFTLSFLFLIFYILILVPGIRYLTVYQKPDTRFQASEWIYKNIPDGSYILSETANVVDIPIPNNLTMKQFNNYNVISFNFYDLDESLQLQEKLKEHLSKADYIFVPSRRVFANHPKDKYPMLNEYYEELFNGQLGFKKVAEFSAGLNDEEAEETWSVFDHPTIRIYKRSSGNPKS